MDYHTGSAVDDGNGVVEKHVVQELAPNAANNGTPSAEDGEKVPESNGIPRNEAKADGEQDASEAEPCQETKVSISAKKSDAKADGNNDSEAEKKSTGAQPNSKGPKTPLNQNHKSSLIESLSFPSKGPRGSVLRKSVGASPLMTTDKQLRKNGRRSSDVNPSLNASLPRTSDPINSDGKTTNQVNSNESKNGEANKHISATSKPTIQQSKFAKSGSTDNANALASHASLLTVQRPKDSEPIKESYPDDMNDAKSTSATNDQRARRNSVSGFAFRSNERAEKRKEFNMKIEEKIIAKEAEKCNLQAKSKESQEAEIKQLRKSLTFKATPLPSFYNEPPPHVELKKIPTTRPISPKLGRSKTSSRTKNAPQVDGSFGSLQIVNDLPKSANLSHLDKSIDLNSKKVIRKSQAKIQSQESGAVNKPASKSKIKNGGENEHEKTHIEKNKEEEPTDTHPQSSSDCVGNTQGKDNVEELIPDNGMITGAATQKEAIPNEIVVGG